MTAGGAPLAEQQAYYRARADEYDEWWERRGRYDRGPDANERWFREVAEVRRAFDALPLDSDVVELASGTGYWTEALVERGARVTAIDGSAEMLAVNRARLGTRADAVEYREADLFEWVPDRRWPGLVFCFWISHVPRERLSGFLHTCAAALEPGGSMFFLDGRRTPLSTAADHVLPADDAEIMTRRLNDGREFRIVKNYYTPEELSTAADQAGLAVDVHDTATFFRYAVGRHL